MLKWPWKRKRQAMSPSLIRYDMHSHLLPGVDDGVNDFDEACAAIELLMKIGYQGAVTTPHVYPGMFDNSTDELLGYFESFRLQIKMTYPDFPVRLGAEYYLDDSLVERIRNHPDSILRFGRKNTWFLVELPTKSPPEQMVEFFKACGQANLRPIIAHVERYEYIMNHPVMVDDWRNAGALIQVNLGSFGGQYGARVQTAAHQIYDAGVVNFIGTDLHRPRFGRGYLSSGWRNLAQNRTEFDPTYHHQLIDDGSSHGTQEQP